MYKCICDLVLSGTDKRSTILYIFLSLFSPQSHRPPLSHLRTIRILLKVSAFARVGELRKRGYIVLIEPPSERKQVEKEDKSIPRDEKEIAYFFFLFIRAK